ncbi:MAG: hydantoinase/oxoprolinase family protein [Nitrososphaerota archaeon]|nr:hydantoinase/oxoprolinase family protein [Candidatus Calditenuaceae archaeon]MDW8073875.1 hydantoinase/oxoprolinase family protein [Nitrososphaerota archaeon]
MSLRIGIDVGGTHTDAVILDEKNRLVYAVKTPTTPDVTLGILNALNGVLRGSGVDPEDVEAAMLGTTHCTNAIVERKRLAKVGVIRIGKPATLAVKPLRTFPADLRRAVGEIWTIVAGGHEYDGREITPLNEEEIRRAAGKMRDEGCEAIAICSVFSPVSPDHEKRAAEIVEEEFGRKAPITLSYEIGSIGLLERENAAVLNAAVVKVAEAAINAFEKAMREAGLHKAKLFLTQNDGTLMSADYARKYPIRTVASGPTNSIRGAAFLTQLNDCVVVDIGGTTTLVGVLVRGFPRESAVAVEIGGVRTNFRMPDLIAVGCGGGTLVRRYDGDVEIGPQSLGYELVNRGLAWGGDTLTTTDIALAAGYAKIDDPRCDPARVKHLDGSLIAKAVAKIVNTVENAVDRMKTSAEPVPMVLVGGGGIIIPPSHYDKLKGVSKVIRPEHFQYANAIGAAIAQVSGEVDRIFMLDRISREEALKTAKEMAIREAINAGAKPDTVQVVEVDEIPLAYLPGNAIRIRVKAAGSLAI